MRYRIPREHQTERCERREADTKCHVDKEHDARGLLRAHADRAIHAIANRIGGQCLETDSVAERGAAERCEQQGWRRYLHADITQRAQIARYQRQVAYRGKQNGNPDKSMWGRAKRLRHSVIV